MLEIEFIYIIAAMFAVFCSINFIAVHKTLTLFVMSFLLNVEIVIIELLKHSTWKCQFFSLLLYAIWKSNFNSVDCFLWKMQWIHKLLSKMFASCTFYPYWSDNFPSRHFNFVVLIEFARTSLSPFLVCLYIVACSTGIHFKMFKDG